MTTHKVCELTSKKASLYAITLGCLKIKKFVKRTILTLRDNVSLGISRISHVF